MHRSRPPVCVAFAEAGQEALESAFLRHGPPKHLITDQEGVFVSGVFAELLRRWDVKRRFGTVGQHGSIAVTERAILALKQEWLRCVPVIQRLDHLTQLLAAVADYSNEWRGHLTPGGAVPGAVHRGEHWQKPPLSVKHVSGRMECQFFPDTRTTADRLAVLSEAGFTAP